MSSDYLNRYKNRVSRSGDNVGSTYTNNTISFIESTFTASPTYRVMEVDSYEFPDIKQIEARALNVQRLGTLRELLFRPYQGLNLGTYVTFDSNTWLVIDQWGDRNNYKYTALVQKCNHILKWKDTDGTLLQMQCLASQSPLNSKATQGRNDIQVNSFDVNLAVGRVYLFLEKNPTTDKVALNKRFVIGRNVYMVYGLDDTSYVDKSGHGVVQYTLRLTTAQEQDDFVNGIAFNEFTEASPQIVEPVSPDTTTDSDGLPNSGNNEGGKIW